MSERLNDDLHARRALMSALADGEAATALAACALWRADPAAREAWHTYHLIGDTLRSADLAAPRAGDIAFLARLRKRLAAEPTTVTPQPPAAAGPPGRRRSWLAPAALAAGVVAVAAVLAINRMAAPGADVGAGTVLVSAPPAAAAAPGALPLHQGVDRPGEPQWQLVDGKLIRDARLDAYLRAHRGGPAALPGGATGRFETVVLER